MNKINKLKQHQEEYIHIRKPNMLSFLGIIIFGFLSYFWFLVVKSSYYILEIDKIMKKELININISSLYFILTILIEYIFISLLIISITAFLKGGYNKLKSYEENGLILGLIAGSILGLIAGLIHGLIHGLIAGSIHGLILGLIAGSILGLINGLIAGSINGLIVELENEKRK